MRNQKGGDHGVFEDTVVLGDLAVMVFATGPSFAGPSPAEDDRSNL